MKKLLMLGGSLVQVPAIKMAVEMGHYVIVCDYLKDNPGSKYAHEYYDLSITDKDAVFNLAKLLGIDGIVSYASDAGAPTAAYVAEKLRLPSHPYVSVEILSNKDKFREFQLENNLNVPKAKGYSTVEEALVEIQQFRMPVMIKPVDSSGSRGVTKLESIELLHEKVQHALSFSRSQRFIIEEYIENFGYHVGGDGFSVDGKLEFHCFSNEHFPEENSPNPFVPTGSSWPLSMPEHIQTKIILEIQRTLDLLQMKTGAYNFDIRVGKDEKVYIIELAARNGGDWLPQMIDYATGVNLVEYTIKAALGQDCSDLVQANTQSYWAIYVLNSRKSGIFKEVKMDEDFRRNNIHEMEIFVKKGEVISSFTGSNAKIGKMVLRFSSMEEMLEKMDCMSKWVQVQVDSSFIKT